MILWHVASKKKLLKYIAQGKILAPVRAWKKIESAQRFSVQTGRRIILRLKSNSSFKELEGHKNEAMVSEEDYELNNF